MQEKSAKLDNVHELKRLIAEGDMRTAVRFLNGLTQHRFTALYRFEGANLTNLTFFDREDPEQVSIPTIPVTASYCAFVRSRARPFLSSDSMQDELLIGHPKRETVRSYCGVPLRDVDGRIFGTICHFDYAPRSISIENVELLESVAPLLCKFAVSGRIH